MLVMLGGFLAGICTFFLASRLGDYLIETRYMSEEALHRRNMAAVENLQAFIKDNNLSSRDTDQLAIWSIEQKDIYILFYKNRHLAMEAGWWGVDNEFSLGGSELNEQVSLQLYPVSFRDGVFQAVVYDFSESKLYDAVQVIGIALGCALPWQWVDDIPRESWDIPLGACVDGEEIRYFSGGKNPSKS